MSLRIIGDVHGKFSDYLRIVKTTEHSLQVGDFGYHQSYEWMLNSGLDFAKHKVLLGNHDQYDLNFSEFPFVLPDFGFTNIGGVDILYVRGAFSIDKKVREYNYWMGDWPKTWFENEELTYRELSKALEFYCKVKPDIVVTHDCPKVFGNYLSNPEFLRNWGFDGELKTQTQMALQAMWDKHKPSYWYCGHYHRSFSKEIEGTTFRCLAELEFVDI